MVKNNKKNFLFFFVHPSKYYLFRYTVNYLIQEGHKVDIAIIKKEVLEDLVKQEGWEYFNIFPEGRRSKSTNIFLILLTTAFNLFRTVSRLNRLTKGKKYDVFVTDDCLSIVGWLKKTPVIMFTDDDLNAVKENAILFSFAEKIIAPVSTDLGRFNKKKISLRGYKELAFLHPKYFTPDEQIVREFNPELKKYVVIRLVSLTASHDTNKKGLSDKEIIRIFNLLEDKYLIFLSSERPLNKELERYRLKIKPELISHIIFFAEMLISDSQTMTSEAAVLGTPSVRFNDFVGRINSMEEKEIKYKLTFGFRTNEFDEMLLKIKELALIPDLKQVWQNRRQKMLDDSEDVNAFLINMFENYPENVHRNN